MEDIRIVINNQDFETERRSFEINGNSIIGIIENELKKTYSDSTVISGKINATILLSELPNPENTFITCTNEESIPKRFTQKHEDVIQLEYWSYRTPVYANSIDVEKNKGNKSCISTTNMKGLMRSNAVLPINISVKEFEKEQIAEMWKLVNKFITNDNIDIFIDDEWIPISQIKDDILFYFKNVEDDIVSGKKSYTGFDDFFEIFGKLKEKNS